MKSRRQILHKRIAEILREKFPDIVEAQPEILAYHFTQPGLEAPAIEYWGRAGDRALRRSAFKEAISHLGKAIELTEGVSAPTKAETSRKLKLQVSYGNALISSRGYGAPETTAAFERARKIVGDDRESPERSSVTYGLWVGSYMHCELAEMREMAAAFVSDVESRPHAPEAGVAHRINGVTKWLAGDFSGATSDYEKALAIFDPVRDADLAFRFGQDPGVGALAYQSLTLWPLGQVEAAIQSIKAVKTRVARLTHISTIAYAKMHTAVFELMRSEYVEAAPHARSLAELAREHDLKLWRLTGVFFEGWNAWRGNDPVGGRSEMRRGLASLREEKVFIFDGLLRCASARAEAESGDFSAALTCLEQAISAADRTGAHWCDAEVLRTRGEILVKQDPTNCGAAEESFLTAIAIAQHQNARSFELRAALALARLYRSIGRAADTDAVLRSALKGFVPTPQFPEIAEALDLAGDVQADLQSHASCDLECLRNESRRITQGTVIARRGEWVKLTRIGWSSPPPR